MIHIWYNVTDIPVAVILTKVDEICEDVSHDVSVVFRSLAVKERLDMISEKLGILRSFIQPVSIKCSVSFAQWECP